MRFLFLPLLFVAPAFAQERRITIIEETIPAKRVIVAVPVYAPPVYIGYRGAFDVPQYTATVPVVVVQRRRATPVRDFLFGR